MSDPIDELEIRAMLDARAERVHPAAAREILAAVATHLDRPGAGLEVPVRPVTVARPPIRRRAWLGAGMAAVVVVGLVGVLVLGAPPGRDGLPVGGSPSAAGTQTASTPAAMTVDAFRQGLASGELDGRTVLMTAALKVTPLRCLGDCQRVEVVGLEGIEVRYWTTNASSADIRAKISAHPGQVRMAFRIDAAALVLLGWPQQEPATAKTVRQLYAPAPEITDDDLAVVSGWLIGAPAVPVSCPAADPSTDRCPGSLPALTDTEPMPDGRPLYGDAIEVTVDESVGLEPAPVAIPGPFLLRKMLYYGGDLPPYQVVASLDPAIAVRVELPNPSSTEEQDLVDALAVDRLLLALKDGSMDGRLVLVTGTLDTVAQPCPADVPEPCTRFFIPGLDGVAVTWDGALRVWNDTTVDGASPGPSPIRPVAGTLVVTPRNGHLELLGRLPGNLEQPLSLQDLLYRRGPALVNPDPFALTAVAGWLVVGGIHSCPLLGPGATPCPGPGPLLTDKEPFPQGMMASDLQVQVGVWPNAVGIDPAQIVTPGPFLYRVRRDSTCGDGDPSCAGGRIWSWEVMARYDAGSVFRVTPP